MAKFAPPTEDELNTFAPPEKEEQAPTFAPPTQKELSTFAPPSPEEISKFAPPEEPAKEGGLFVGEDITSEEIQNIAKQYNTSPDLLTRLAPYYGASVEGEGGVRQAIGRSVGFASEALGGIPTFLAKKLSPEIDENAEKALDALNELAQKKKSYLQAGAEMASALAIPTGAAIKGAGKLGTAAIAGAEGALYGLGESKTGEELEAAALGAGVGVAAGPVLAGAVKGVKVAKDLYKAYRAPKEEVADIVRASQKVNPVYKIEEEITEDKLEGWKKQAEDLYDELKTGVNEGRLKEVAEEAKEVLGRTAKKKPVEALRDKAMQTSKEDFSTLYIRAKSINAIKQEAPSHISNVNEVRTGASRIVNIVADGMTEARDIDTRRGSRFVEAMLSFGRGANLAGYSHKSLQEGITKANRTIYSSGKEGNLRAFKALNDHTLIASLPKKEKEAVEAIKNTLEKTRLLANENGVPITILGGEKSKGYLPKRSVDIAESSVRIENKANEIARRTGINPFEVKQSEWDKILEKGTKEYKEFAPLKQTLLAYTGKMPATAEEFSGRMKELINPGSDVFSKEVDIRALHKRMDVLPEYLVETNVVKLANGYLADTIKYIYQKDSLNMMDYEIKKLAALYGENDVDVVQMRNRLNNVLGEVSGIPSVAKKVEIWWRSKMLRTASHMEEGTPGREFIESIVDTPDVIRSLRNNIYGNFLQGPVQFLNNFNGALSTFVPEMGNIYGVRLAPGAMMRVMANMGKKAYWEMLEKKGYLQVEPGREMVEAAKGGKPTPIILQGLEKLSKGLSYPFARAEDIIRAFSYEASQMVFDQMQKGLVKGGKMPKMAGSYFEKLPPSFKNSIVKQFESGNEEKARELFTMYIADRVAFSYNKMAQSEAARNIGPSMAAFTKYPSVIVGRSLELWRENEGYKKVPAFFNYFLASYVAMSMVNNLMFANHPEMEEKIFGKQDKDAIFGRGLAGQTNWATLASILQDGQRAPVPIQVGKQAVRAIGDLAEGNPDAGYKLVKTVFETYAPGGLGGLPRTIENLTGEDVPYLGKER